MTLTSCIEEIKIWMTCNMLRFNDDKTEFFIATSPHFKRQMPLVHLKIGDKIIQPSAHVRNLGVIFDDVMCMSPQIISLSSSITYHLRNITRIRRFLDFNACSHVVRSLVLSRLDYGNALLLGTNTTHINKLQHLQNWAAKLVFKASRRDHASHFLKQLHWLPIQERIHYKILLYIFKCLNGLGPEYLAHGLTCLQFCSPWITLITGYNSFGCTKNQLQSVTICYGKEFLIGCTKIMELFTIFDKILQFSPEFQKIIENISFPTVTVLHFHHYCVFYVFCFYFVSLLLCAVILMEWRLINALYVCMYV